LISYIISFLLFLLIFFIHYISECIPPSLRFFSGNEQVDLARKIQEDPLYAIKKKEMETRNQLLKNPIKLKKLKELVSEYIYFLVYTSCLLIYFVYLPYIHTYIIF